MNVNTGHLIASLDDIVGEEKSNYEELHGQEAKEAKEANVILNGKRDHYLDLSEKSRLANKARNIRKKKKKMSQKSKVKNKG